MPCYERVAFEKALLAPQGQPLAAFLCPGHPLLNAVIDIMLERYRDLLRRGTAQVDERDPAMSPRVLFFLEHAIQDASLTRSGERRVVWKRLAVEACIAELAKLDLGGWRIALACLLAEFQLAELRAGKRQRPH